MNIQTHFTHIQACTLIAHEAVSMLDTVQTEMPECMKDFRTALEALSTIHELGEDGETLLAWLDTEIGSAERFVNEGVNLPYMIDMCRLNTEPDAIAQMELIWLLFDTAVKEECGPEQRRALASTARTITEMCGLDDLLLATLKPNVSKLAEGLDAELDDIHAALRVSAGTSARPARQESEEEPAPPAGPAM